MPRVSVVMPSLNQVEFLETAVTSVLDQTFDDLELIVADGLSTDGTVQLLARLAGRYRGRLIWSSCADTGPADALNSAMAKARGRIVGWLNSDDLYLPGAINRAVDFFDHNPSAKLLYGNARHVDSSGEDLGPYPTLPPSSVDQFRFGCFICQPSVFIHRSVIDELGFLDTAYATAFDFDFWLRCFRRYAGAIHMVPDVQCFSRLHPRCITRTARRNVALESMSIIAKNFGAAPATWFWTHANECADAFPFGIIGVSYEAYLERFLDEAICSLGTTVAADVRNSLRGDARCRLSSSSLFATVEPDGWVSQTLEVRHRAVDIQSAITLHCEAPWPTPQKLTLQITGPLGVIHKAEIETGTEFVLRLHITMDSVPSNRVWRIDCDRSFVPAEIEEGSRDTRSLSFKVKQISVE